MDKSRQRQKEADLESFKKKQAKQKTKLRQTQNSNIDDRQRIYNFKRAVLFGPIFIFSCCKRWLYEKSVTEITKYICDKINTKHPGLYKKCIPEGAVVRYLAHGTYKAGIYICITCKNTMMNGKIPCMAEINGLQKNSMHWS